MIWLLLLGLITYIFVQTVAGSNRTPVWLLWSVAMIPAFALAFWQIIYRGRRSVPTEWVIPLVVGSLLLYLYLMQKGRTTPQTFGSSTDPTIDPALPDDGEFIKPTEEDEEPPILRPITKAEESELRNCFPWAVYYLQQIEYRPQAVICRGQMRGKPDVVYEAVRKNVEVVFGDRFHVVFQEGAQNKPFFALVPNSRSGLEVKPREIGRKRWLTRPVLFAIVMATTTFITMTFAGLQLAGKVLFHPLTLIDGVPYAFCAMLFFAARAIGHYAIVRRYHIASTLPYFIPVIPLSFFPLGTVGAYLQLRSPIPNRKALFDIGVVGAMLGLCVSIPMLAWGLTLSDVVGMSSKAGIFDANSLNPRFSIVLTLFSKLVFGPEMVERMAIKPHAVAIAGWIGLLFTAFNLMPVGQLDGGRMVHAMFGQRGGAMVSQVARFLLLVLSVVQPQFLAWAILLLLLPTIDEPALNDVTEIDDFRDIVGLMLLTILILIVMPAPKVLTEALGM